MSAEWVTAIATLGTFLVIAASAIAALMQLRHMRSGNQIAALTESRERLETAEFSEASNFVVHELPKLLADPAYLDQLTALSTFPKELEAARSLANFYDMLGGFVKNGVIDSDIACDYWSSTTLRHWRAFAPLAYHVRRIADTMAIWENFEYLAVVSERWIAAHPDGNYPRNTPRMPPG